VIPIFDRNSYSQFDITIDCDWIVLVVTEISTYPDLYQNNSRPKSTLISIFPPQDALVLC
jgi:hypothetical protein